MLQDQHFVQAVDYSQVQAVVLSAAVAGDPSSLTLLPGLSAGFDEPFRAIASEVIKQVQQGIPPDWNLIGAALEGRPLIMPDASGKTQQVTAGAAINLIRGGSYTADQVVPYVGLMREHIQKKRRQEFGEHLTSVVAEYSKSPDTAIKRIEDLVTKAKRGEYSSFDLPPSELEEMVPYMKQLASGMCGTTFVGLNSGFPNLNEICNGLDAGLMVMAAPPGLGKTTLLWQICCNVAESARVPAIFFSLEQSKEEMRAKLLGRFADIQYKHLLRGRLHSSDEQDMQKVLQAANRWAQFASHLHIIEGDDHTTIDTIRQISSQVLHRSGASRCLIAVDYLQQIPVSDAVAQRIKSEKDKVDLHTSALRRLGRDLESPVIAISSENRAGYGRQDMSVFKESGGIEYSADIAVVMTREKDAEPQNRAWRTIKFNVVKNRNGETSCVKFKFYPAVAKFVEEGREALPDESLT